MTVRELIARLSEHDPEAKVTAHWDCVSTWPVQNVIAFRGRVVLDVESGSSGDLTAADLESMSPKG